MQHRFSTRDSNRGGVHNVAQPKHVHQENMLVHSVIYVHISILTIILINRVVCLLAVYDKVRFLTDFCDIYIIDKSRQRDRSDSSEQINGEGC